MPPVSVGCVAARPGFQQVGRGMRGEGTRAQAGGTGGRCRTLSGTETRGVGDAGAAAQPCWDGSGTHTPVDSAPWTLPVDSAPRG